MIDRTAILKLWQGAKIRSDVSQAIARTAAYIEHYKDLYDPIEKALGIPWYVVGALDSREENFNHHGYLGNGDPLYQRTTHVPRGRGPFSTWSDGAIDALTMNGFNRLPEGGHWDIVTALIKCEGYNGLGYSHMGLPSPYVWAGTNQQVAGKYVNDGEFDPHAWDNQPGCAALFLSLKESFNVDLREA